MSGDPLDKPLAAFLWAAAAALVGVVAFLMFLGASLTECAQ